VLVLSCLVSIVASQNGDLIVNLPGLKNTINFKQYAGYKTVDPVNNRQLFYWFVEASRVDPTTAPLVLWLNGGPGCSSLGGFFTEQGPFRPQKGGQTLAMNNFAWNQNANVIFLESPAGVGFSKSDNQADYTTGDVRTANDAYMFLQQFLKDYPQYQGRPFWVSGESYGGHYVPELADRILTGNNNNEGININIQGFLVGNAWTYMPIDNRGAVDYWHQHALISDETYNGIVNNCNFTDIGPLKLNSWKLKDSCDDFLNTANIEMGNINIYDIFVNVCTQSIDYLHQYAKVSPVHKIMSNKIQGRWPPYHPCAENFMGAYLNRADVQKAIHANISYPWVQCSNIVSYNYSDVEASVLPLYQKFQNTKLKILVYSGDVDAIVPVTGTRAWIADPANVGNVVQPWRPWSVGGQVGGYVTGYQYITFSTVRGAGHMVPETQPSRALAMLNAWISNQVFPPATEKEL